MSRLPAPRALALLAIPLLAAGPALLAAPASAADELGLSSDGVHWVSSITGPLFDGPVHWVPGDSETATFYIRNQSGDAGDLVVDVVGPGGALLDSGDLRVTARGAGGDWTTVSAPGTHRLLTAPDLAAGTVAPVDVTVSLAADSRNQSQRGSTGLIFRVTLSESIPGGGPTDAPTGTPSTQPSSSPSPSGPATRPAGVPAALPQDGGASPLPRTGADLASWAFGLAAVLIGAGLAFVSRRPGRGGTHPPGDDGDSTDQHADQHRSQGGRT